MQRAATLLYRTYLVWIFLGGLAWIFDLPSKLGLPLIQYEWLAPYLGVAVAAVLLKIPLWQARRSGRGSARLDRHCRLDLVGDEHRAVDVLAHRLFTG